jgi:uncharacterized protein (DUF58 family)
MAFGTATRLKSDLAEGVAAVVGRVAVRRGGRVAVVTAGEAAPRMLRPRGGRGALASLSRLVGSGVSADGTTGAPLATSLVRVARLARTRGLVIVVSDFRDEPGTWSATLRRLAARHTVVAVEVTDPREGTIPDVGHLHLVDPETGELVEIDTSAPRLRDHVAGVERRRREELASTLRRAPARHVVLSTDGDWLRDLGRALR